MTIRSLGGTAPARWPRTDAGTIIGAAAALIKRRRYAGVLEFVMEFVIVNTPAAAILY
jgi:hypothetical protein